MAEGETGGTDSSLKRRNPAVPKRISEISVASDRRVRLAGKIAKKGTNGQMTLEDGSGKTDVFFDNLDVVDSIDKTYKEGDSVLVVGLVVPQDGNRFDINGEILKASGARKLSEEAIKRAESVIRNG